MKYFPKQQDTITVQISHKIPISIPLKLFISDLGRVLYLVDN